MSKTVAFLAVAIMITSGTAIYFSAAISGSSNFEPVQPHPITFSPAQTIDSTGAEYGAGGAEHTTSIGNTTWCIAGFATEHVFDLGQTVCLNTAGQYNTSSYGGPSNYFIDIIDPSGIQVEQYSEGIGYYLSTNGILQPYKFTSTGTWDFQLQVCTDPTLKTVEYSALEPLTVNADPTISTPVPPIDATKTSGMAQLYLLIWKA